MSRTRHPERVERPEDPTRCANGSTNPKKWICVQSHGHMHSSVAMIQARVRMILPLILEGSSESTLPVLNFGAPKWVLYPCPSMYSSSPSSRLRECFSHHQGRTCASNGHIEKQQLFMDWAPHHLNPLGSATGIHSNYLMLASLPSPGQSALAPNFHRYSTSRANLPWRD